MERRGHLDPDLVLALAAAVVALLLAASIALLAGITFPPWAWGGIGVVVVLLLSVQIAILLAARDREP